MENLASRSAIHENMPADSPKGKLRRDISPSTVPGESYRFNLLYYRARDRIRGRKGKGGGGDNYTRVSELKPLSGVDSVSMREKSFL